MEVHQRNLLLQFELPSSQEPTADPNVELLDINMATLEELTLFQALDQPTAQKIMDYRMRMDRSQR